MQTVTAVYGHLTIINLMTVLKEQGNPDETKDKIIRYTLARDQMCWGCSVLFIAIMFWVEINQINS